MQYVQDNDETEPPNDQRAAGTGQLVANWLDLMYPYVKSQWVFLCPSAQESEYSAAIANPTLKFTYASNNVYYWDASESLFGASGTGCALASIEDNSGTIFAGDATGGAWDPFWKDYHYQVVSTTQFATKPPQFGDTNQGRFTMRHNGGANFIFFDGHVKWMSMGTLLTPSSTKPGYYKYLTKTLD